MRRSVILVTIPLAAAVLIQFHLRETARSVAVQVRVEMRRVETLYSTGVFAGNLAVAHVLTDDRSVFAFHQRIIRAAGWAATG